MKITYQQIINNDTVKTYIKKADESLSALGYTEHSFTHVGKVAKTASDILLTLGYSEHEAELARIAGYLHDIGNVINRIDHAQSGAVMAFRILDKMEMDAEDIVLELPSLTLIGFADKEIARAVQHRMSTPYLRVYTTDDVVSMQIGGAIKNVFALASGICAGLGLGDNARAALATRGLAEMTRIGMARGGRMDTFMGLSGMGDLVVTCYSEHSRNLTSGRLIAKGVPVDECQARIGQVVEGIPNTLSTYQLARKLGVRTPITDAMYEILYCGKPARQALDELMTRDLREESLTE